MRVGNDVILMGSDVLFPYNHDHVDRAGNGMEAAARALPTRDVSFSILACALQVDADLHGGDAARSYPHRTPRQGSARTGDAVEHPVNAAKVVIEALAFEPPPIEAASYPKPMLSRMAMMRSPDA
jgi:hypothetical protein